MTTLSNHRIKRVGALVAAALLFHLVLIQPNHPEAMTWGALRLFPLELPALLLGLLALGAGRTSRVARILLVAALIAVITWKVADATMFSALSRGFNPLTDLPLISAFLNLISGTFGWLVAVLGAIAAVVITVILAWLLWRAAGVWARVPLVAWQRAVAGGLAVLAFAVVIGDVGDKMRRWSMPIDPPGTAFTARFGVERVALIGETLTNIRTFRTAVQTDAFADQTGLLDIIDRDVFVIFVESYGRTSFDTPQYADLHLDTLRAAEAELDALGLTMASTFLKSPTRGGQSWLAHSTFANGLWVTDQSSYGAVLNSGRQTLYHIAQNAGFRTVAIMPQITLAWPESVTMGFETIYAAADLGYEGLPFNWITMPDQFTFSAMDRLLGGSSDPAPVFAQIVLGSSHAPWVPVPDLIDWDDVGDGTIYNETVEASDTPQVVWADHDRVRTQYGLAVDYALQTTFSFVARRADDAPLIFVIGDHQAAGFIALDERADVPMHVIGPAHLVERVMDDDLGGDFYTGLIPPADTTVTPMTDMRSFVLRTFSSGVAQ